MIKLEKDFLNKSKRLMYRCENCGYDGSYNLGNPTLEVSDPLSGIDIDDDCQPINKDDIKGFDCEKCMLPLES